MSNIYSIGSPAMPAVSMKLSNGRNVNVTTENWSKENVYVDKMYLNGEEYDKSYITYEYLRNGADIKFVMSAEPNTTRATSAEAVAPSISKPGETKKYVKQS